MDKIQNTEDRLEKISHDIGEKIGTKALDLIDTTGNFVKSKRQFVQENPVAGVAIAAAAGLVIGSVITMALRRQ